ncbi:MAG: DUF883 family protein [Rhodobacterales bacterium]|nr:DUF883 family protein [Rhodobacterales bacterium]
MAPNSKPSADPAEALAKEVASLRQDVRALAESLAQLASTQAEDGDLREKIIAQLGELGAKGREGVEAAQSEIDRLVSGTTAYAREQPVRALGFAALAGMVLGLLIGRR